jgi:hypothetical protein
MPEEYPQPLELPLGQQWQRVEIDAVIFEHMGVAFETETNKPGRQLLHRLPRFLRRSPDPGRASPRAK